MTRLLSILLLSLCIADFTAAAAPGLHAGGLQALELSQASGDFGGPMAGTGCGACATMGACIASGPAPSAGSGISQPPPRQPSSQLSDQACAPDTAPPKRSSI